MDNELSIYDEVEGLQLTEKQWEFLRLATHKINLKKGAIRSGKTWLDFTIMIPLRIAERKGLKGLVYIFGVSKASIEANIISPMRERWGKRLVGEISSDNTIMIFGEKVRCIGTVKKSAEPIIRGTCIKYCYCDEVNETNEDVFMLILGRLDRTYSVMDGAYNPKGLSDWFKLLVDKYVNNPKMDIYVQKYTIWDNTTLDPVVVEGLCESYRGTVFYDRYILGKDANAEGIIYGKFANNPEQFIIDKVPDDIIIYSCGIDYGGNKSAHTFVLIGITSNYRSVVVLENEEIKEVAKQEVLDSDKLDKLFIEFVNRCTDKYHCYFETNYDNAEPVLARGMQNDVERAHCRTTLVPAWKTAILDRIRLEIMLMGSGRFFVMRNCNYVIDSLKSCIWDGKRQDVRLDDCKTNDIDILDALEYAMEKYSADLLDYDFAQNKGDIYAQFRKD